MKRKDRPVAVRAVIFGAQAALLAAVIAVSPVPAQQFDWGGTFDSASNLRSDALRDDPELQQILRLGLWGELFAELREERTVRATIEGSYRFEYDQDPDEDPLQVANLDILRFQAFFPLLFGPGSTFEVAAGRFVFSEPTGAIWTHPGDGLRLDARFFRWRLELAGAYTGLLLNPMSGIRMTPTDTAEEDDTDELFGPRRAIALLRPEFPDLIGRQSLSPFAILQFDLRDPDDGEETLNTQYLGARASGPIQPVLGLYYELFGVRGFGSFEAEGADDTSLSMGLYGSRLRYYRDEYRFSRVILEWLHASGGDALDAFTAINAPATGFAFSPDLTNLMLATAGYSLRPLSGSPSAAVASLQTGITARGYFRSSTADILDAPGLDLESDSRYVGTETELRAVMRPSSDLGFSFTNAIFFPNDDLLPDSDPWYRGRLELSLGF